MSTQMPSWVASWLIVFRDQPEGCWIINGQDAVRVDPAPTYGVIIEPQADNENLIRGARP